MAKFSKVLVALDGSQPSIKAAGLGIVIAKRSNNPQVTAIHVIHSSIPIATLVTPSTIDTMVNRAKQEAEKWLNEVRRTADQNGVRLKIEFIVNPASIVAAIVDHAQNHYIDLIVIGSRGLSGFKKLLLGSTALGVLTYASCPVLVVK